ncbi:hypothetical protein HAX54_008305, partial [Datura stramonium]|nr:hypothetical protein [Datura stramonium]
MALHRHAKARCLHEAHAKLAHQEARRTAMFGWPTKSNPTSTRNICWNRSYWLSGDHCSMGKTIVARPIQWLEAFCNGPGGNRCILLGYFLIAIVGPLQWMMRDNKW